MTTFSHGFPGITIWPIREDVRLNVSIDGAAPEADERTEQKIEATWAKLTEANPRLFDGPILALAQFNPATGAVVCRRDTYRRLTVQGEVETGVVLMAVNGVITARDRAGVEHVLLGRRSVSTRMYGGMWELIPAGGLEPPREGPNLSLFGADQAAGSARGSGGAVPGGLASGGASRGGAAHESAPGWKWRDGDVPIEHLLNQLTIELRQEAGLDSPIDAARPVAFYRDEFARSFNIVFAAHLPMPIEDIPLVERDWDCDAVWWLPRAEADDFGRKMPIIPPSRGLLRMTGWLP